MRTHSLARSPGRGNQPLTWAPASPSANHPHSPSDAHLGSPGAQAAVSFASPWSSEHMGGTRAATRGPKSLGPMDAAQRALVQGDVPWPPVSWDPGPAYPGQSQGMLC